MRGFYLVRKENIGQYVYDMGLMYDSIGSE